MDLKQAKIVYLTAGAAGMYCGSCLRDNALAASMQRRGIDMILVPLYTPIRTDETDVSVDKVFFGGINVYLQQKIPLFRHLPRVLDRWLDAPWLINRLAARSVKVDAGELGALTLSMVRGESGYQRKEIRRLVEWLKDEIKPDLICLTNLLVGGCIPMVKRELDVPVLVTLQGDDLFLEELDDNYRTQVLDGMRALAREADGFLVFSDFYARRMGELLDLPAEKMHRTAVGADLEDFDQVGPKPEGTPPTVGYFARLCPEKGLDRLIDGFLRLKENPAHDQVRLRLGGWLAEEDREFFEAQRTRLSDAGHGDRVEYLGSPDMAGKLDFFRGIDLMCVPTRYEEPKGLFALEAMACGRPVVVPAHGAFPELMEASGGGVLVPPGDPEALARALDELLSNEGLRRERGERGRKWVRESCSREVMTDTTAAVFDRFLSRVQPVQG